MNARSLVVTLSLLALTTPAFAQEPAFGDLAVTETSTTVRESTYRRAEVDTESFDAALAETRKQLDEAGEHFRAIYVASESLYRELGGNVALGHWTEKRFLFSKANAAEFRARASKLEGLLTRLLSFFSELKTDDRTSYDHLAPRHAMVVALVTEYDELMAWASTFNLDFDTARLFEERDMIVLPRDTNPRLDFPVLPLRQNAAAAALDGREEVEGRNGAALVRNSNTVVVTRSREYRASDPEAVKALLLDGGKLADEADATRSRILGLATDTAGGRLRFENLRTFDCEVKPLTVSFALTMLRLKGVRNGAWALLDGSDLMVGDGNVQAAWKELERRFSDLARWGDTTSIRFSALGQRDRIFVPFFRTNFATTGLFLGSGRVDASEERYDTVAGAVAAPGTLSVDDAFRLVKGVSGASRRRDMCYKVIPLTRGLDAKTLTNLASWIGQNSYEDDVIAFGLQHLDR